VIHLSDRTAGVFQIHFQNVVY